MREENPSRFSAIVDALEQSSVRRPDWCGGAIELRDGNRIRRHCGNPEAPGFGLCPSCIELERVSRVQVDQQRETGSRRRSA